MDFRNDNNTYGIDFVKKALKDKLPSYISSDEQEDKDLTKVASSAFADEVNREYPINTKKNTWYSIAYFYTQGNKKYAASKVKEMEQQFLLASMVHGIKDDAKNIIDCIITNTGMNKVAHEKKEYAIENSA